MVDIGKILSDNFYYYTSNGRVGKPANFIGQDFRLIPDVWEFTNPFHFIVISGRHSGIGSYWTDDQRNHRVLVHLRLTNRRAE